MPRANADDRHDQRDRDDLTCHRIRPPLGFTCRGWLVYVGLLLIAAPPAFAQQEAPPPPEPGASSEFRDRPAPSEVVPDRSEAEAAAVAASAAEEAANEARRAYERALREAEEAKAVMAEARRAEAARIAEAAAAEAAAEEAARATAAEAQKEALPPEWAQAIEDAKSAAEEARSAADDARRIALDAREKAEAYERRYSRSGFLLGLGANYLLENFDTSLEVDNGEGLYALIGYRFHPHASVELRGEWLAGFDVRADEPSGGSLDAELDGYLITVGPKLYPFTGSVQPFVGIGVGVFHAELEGLGRGGGPIDSDANSIVFRFAGGLDYFISENFVLNVEAAYVEPGGDLDGLGFGSLSAGATFRF